MHIVHVISAYGRAHIGNEIHGELARAIIARGHRYSVLTLAGSERPRGLHTWNDGGVAVFEMGRGRGALARAEGALSTRLFHYQPFLFALRAYGRTMRAHLRDASLVLVEGGYPLGAIAALWQPRLGVPLALVLQGGDMHREDGAHYGFGRYAVARRLLRLALRRAALLRTYSPLARDAAIARGADPARIAVVAQNIGEVCFFPPGTDVAAARAAARAAVAARHGVQSRHLLVGVGRLLPIKGFDGLIRALPQIAQQAGAAVDLVLCGPGRAAPGVGDYRAYLAALADEVGVGARVHFTGELPHTAVRDYLAAADVLVVPSVMEGGAKVIMEGAAVGTPFVGTETAGTPAFVPDGGLCVPPLAAAPHALPRAVALLLRNEGLRLRMGRAALARAPMFRAGPRADELLPHYCKAGGESWDGQANRVNWC